MEFPIPMRGNEISLGEPETVDGVKFPIPMRGNELRLPGKSISSMVVPDPHEG